MATDQKSILITGTSTGIGRACALHMAKLGFKTYSGVRKESDIESLNGEGVQGIEPIIIDVTDSDSIQAAFERISADQETPLMAIVNNAGIAVGGVQEAVPADDFRHLLEVNVIGVHMVTRTFLPLLRRNKGRVVNIGSISSYLAGPGAGSYAASKYAVRAMTEALQLELTPLGMHASLIAPGAIESDIWDKTSSYKQKLKRSVDPEVSKAYEFFIKVGEKMADHMKPIPAINVARALEHSLTSDKPKLAYWIGDDAKKVRMLLKLPRRFMNWLIIKHMSQIVSRS